MGQRITFLGKNYTFQANRVVDDEGQVPTRAIGELLSSYLDLLLLRTTPLEDAWCSFRELGEAGPLAVNFANNTHKTITATFKSDLAALDRSVRKVAGQIETGQGFDRRYRFYAFPEIPLILNYNVADDLLPAQACLLFRQTVQDLFNIHQLFILGTYLTGCLIRGADHT